MQVLTNDADRICHVWSRKANDDKWWQQKLTHFVINYHIMAHFDTNCHQMPVFRFETHTKTRHTKI